MNDVFGGVVGGVVSGIVLVIILWLWRHLRRPIYTAEGTPTSTPRRHSDKVIWIRRELAGNFEAKGYRRVLSGLFRRETHWVGHSGEANVLMKNPEGKQ